MPPPDYPVDPTTGRAILGGRGWPRHVGASRDVIEHHARAHDRKCGLHLVYETVCPCGQTVVIICTGCDKPVFYAARSGFACAHVADLDGAVAQ